MKPRVLFVASEATPLIKVGGLADVVGALPSALSELGYDARIVLPLYSAISANSVPNQAEVLRMDVPWQGGQVHIRLLETVLPQTNTVLYLLDAPKIFSDDGVYLEHDPIRGPRRAMERFVFFSWAISELLPKLPWQPEIVHCHDWPAAAVPVFLAAHQHQLPTVLTLHNMESQGKWRADEILSWVGLLGTEAPTLRIRDLENNLNLLQQGIRSATALNTVSPTYAKEILTPLFGAGLDRDLLERQVDLCGIVNGIDVRSFDPAHDHRIVAPYDVATVAAGKLLNKRALLKELALPASAGPLFGFVGRLTSQKGVDLITSALPDIVAQGGQVVILGSGVPDIEQAIRAAAAPLADHVRVIVKFDARLAQQIYAASDFFLMPSRFEPCGLGQLIAMRYGALPIVRDTGGLHDTVRDLRVDQGGTGFIFNEADPKIFTRVCLDALRMYTENDTLLLEAQRRAMNEDVSWKHSAAAYDRLYANTQNT